MGKSIKLICKDCGANIPHKRSDAKRCDDCKHNHLISLMKKYRDTHKKEIKEYQKRYYGRK